MFLALVTECPSQQFTGRILCADVQIDTFNDHEEVTSNKDTLNTKGWDLILINLILIPTQIFELLKRQLNYTVSKFGVFFFLVSSTM
ncbi:unnamed protein product [Parnassius mnemosyne]|uniref:Uncharacterized protein n=1 Tax=Parnassius mnemosyne TaxID=213953 RepID=A0AAV1LBB3_9NEOP